MSLKVSIPHKQKMQYTSNEGAMQIGLDGAVNPTSLNFHKTSRQLELVNSYAPNDFIVEVCQRHFIGGRQQALSAAQLWRTHLLGINFITEHWISWKLWQK